MPLNLFLERTRTYLSSILFPISVGLLAIIMWGVPGNFVWIPAVLYALISFLPLLAKDGRAYMPLMVFIPISCSDVITTIDFPAYYFLLMTAILISMLIFIFLRKNKFVKGDIMIPFAILFFVFLISYIYYSIGQGDLSSEGIIYILSLFVLLLFYVLFSTVLGRGETLTYFCKTYVFLATAICLQVFIYQMRTSYGFISNDFSIGWAYTIRTPSTLLVLSLPFISLLISKKQPIYLLAEIFIIYTIIILSADSALLCLTLAIVPLILLSFKSYGKYYPYITLLSIVITGTTFGLLLAFNDTFNERYLNAILSLNFQDNPSRVELIQTSIDLFLQNPVLGTSISSMLAVDGTIILFSNTVLSTMVMGGSLALAAFLFLEIKIYYSCLKKKSSDKFLFLVFLLMYEVIGLIDNTMFNLAILLLFLVASSSYQMSNRADEVIVHAEYYQLQSNQF